jgi:alpha-L-rhamnosidase
VQAPRCEYRVNPQGIDEPRPRLTWEVVSSERGQAQSAYQILVASTPEKLHEEQADLWNSGRVASDNTVNVPYEGAALESRRRCYWKVRAWDRAGQPSAWSPTGEWTMGLLKDSDWSSEYVSYRDETPVFKDRDSLFLPPARYYRREFKSPKPITRATLYATALGIYEVELNGQRVSDEFFAPGWSDYRQRAYYQTYDVTPLLAQGDNAIGAIVADGWYAGYLGFGLLTTIGTEQIGRYTYGKTPAFMAQLEIEYSDGSRETIATNAQWKVTGEGPVREADLLMGEFYDARRKMPGWAKAGFDDTHWESVVLAKEQGPQPATFYEFRNPEGAGGGPEIKGRPIDLAFKAPKLEAFPGVPVRAIQELGAKSIARLDDGRFIINLGQNFAGTIRLKLKGPEGHQVTIRYGEMLHPDGTLMTENLRRARATDVYICRGDEVGETFVPRFTFHGFQYVELTNFPGTPTAESVTGIALHSDTPLTSEFECSDPMVNRLFQNVVWTQRANFLDLPTDCPQRDERMGWTGDAQVYVGTATINADVAAFYTKWLRELMESQRPSGAFPGYAPFPFQHGWDFGTAWADAGVICPWTIWQAYDDTRVIERCWDPMTRFMKWRESTSQDHLGIAHGNAWGDWLAQGEDTPLEYVDTIYFAISSSLMAQMAAAIGRDAEATHYQDQFDKIKAAFGKKYLRDDGSLTVNTQTAYSLALFANLVPDGLRTQVGKQLATRIANKGNHMATGFLGTRPLLPVLSSVGQNDLAVFLLQSHEFPSWGYEIDQGATSIWERWDSYTKEDGFGRHNAAMNSFAHYSFGAVCEWMFRSLAGIQSGGVGYQQIVIRPQPPSPESNAQHREIDWVKASQQTIRGTIRSEWTVEGDSFTLRVSVPTNTTATVYMPAQQAADVTEQGKPLGTVEGVKVKSEGDGVVVLEVLSGDYHFASVGGIVPAAQAITTSATTVDQ